MQLHMNFNKFVKSNENRKYNEKFYWNEFWIVLWTYIIADCVVDVRWNFNDLGAIRTWIVRKTPCVPETSRRITLCCHLLIRFLKTFSESNDCAEFVLFYSSSERYLLPSIRLQLYQTNARNANDGRCDLRLKMDLVSRHDVNRFKRFLFISFYLACVYVDIPKLFVHYFMSKCS